MGGFAILTIHADEDAAPPRPLRVTITCDGPAMLGVLPAFCAGSVSVRVIDADRWATEVAKERAREAGWTRRMWDVGGDGWVCPECGR